MYLTSTTVTIQFAQHIPPLRHISGILQSLFLAAQRHLSLKESAGAYAERLIFVLLFVSRRGLDNKWRALLCGARGYSAAGWTAFGVGNAMRFIAMRFGAQTVLAGLTSAQFVVIPAAGALLLGEAVTASSIIGILAILIGAHSNGCHPAMKLLNIFKTLTAACTPESKQMQLSHVKGH